MLNVVVSGLTVVRGPLVHVYNEMPLQRPTATHELCCRPRVGSQGRRNSRNKGRIKIFCRLVSILAGNCLAVPTKSIVTY